MTTDLRRNPTTLAPAEAVTVLLDQFHWMADPSVDPIRTRMHEFFVDYLHSKGRDGASIEEGLATFNEAVARDPKGWPAPPDRLEALWRNAWRVLGAKLPPLARPAQLVWLATEAGYDNAIIDAALAQEFRTFTPFDAAKAYREAGAHMQREATGLAMTGAIFQAWADIEKAKGRLEDELLWGNCADDLGIVEERDDGSQYLNFNRLKDIADPELRRAVLGAAWKAQEERR
jgi:hypothetical protein